MERVGTITTIAKGDMSASLSSFGSELQSLMYEGREYIWQADPRWWDWHAPVLFPIVGALRADFSTTEKGASPMEIHGVLRLFDHRMLEATPEMVSYEGRANDMTLKLYPYNFRVVMTYTLLEGNRLEQRFQVYNEDDVRMPFVIGGHPAFNVPVVCDSGEVFEDYILEFSRPWTYSSPTLTEYHLLDWGNRFEVVEDSAVKHLTHRTFDIDTIIFENVPDHRITLKGTKSGYGVTVDFPGFPYCGCWSAMNDAPFVCIEPWTGCATGTDEDDMLASKRGMTLLQPGDCFERAFTIQPF